MEAVSRRRITRTVAIWAVLALIAALALVANRGSGTPTGDSVRRLGGIELLATFPVTTFTIDGHNGTAFYGTLVQPGESGLCESGRTMTVYLDNAGSVPDTSLFSGATTGGEPAQWEATGANPPNAQNWYAILDPINAEGHTCLGAQSPTVSL
jgi:hypothetical protein